MSTGDRAGALAEVRRAADMAARHATVRRASDDALLSRWRLGHPHAHDAGGAVDFAPGGRILAVAWMGRDGKGRQVRYSATASTGQDVATLRLLAGALVSFVPWLAAPHDIGAQLVAISRAGALALVEHFPESGGGVVRLLRRLRDEAPML